MPRPKKKRKISFLPNRNYFKPAGIPKSALKEVVLEIEELEAIRLKDLNGFHQANCAERMEVSRQTFQLILDSARTKVAKALIEGHAIKIEGGFFDLNECPYTCDVCGMEFESRQVEDTCTECGAELRPCDPSDEPCCLEEDKFGRRCCEE